MVAEWNGRVGIYVGQPIYYEAGTHPLCKETNIVVVGEFDRLGDKMFRVSPVNDKKSIIAIHTSEIKFA